MVYLQQDDGLHPASSSLSTGYRLEDGCPIQFRLPAVGPTHVVSVSSRGTYSNRFMRDRERLR